MEHKIEIRDLHYRVPTREILHDVSLQVDKNQFVGLIGPNGSGKTTLLKHIYRALPPEKSTVFINGREIEAFSYGYAETNQRIDERTEMDRLPSGKGS